jgi:polyferredoxin
MSFRFSIQNLHPLQVWRHTIQLLTFIFLNGKLFGLASTGIIVPYLWSMGSPFSTVNSAFESLEYTIAKSVFPLLVLGVIYLTSLTVGRVFCGWACPMGMVQDFLSYLPYKKDRISNELSSKLKDIRWAVLGFSLGLSLLVSFQKDSNSAFSPSVFSESPFSIYSPANTLFTYLPWMLLWNSNVLAQAGFVGWFKFALLIGVLVPSLYIPRFFCRFMCPLGAMMAPLSKFKFLRLYRSNKQTKENFNQFLDEVCPMGVTISTASGADNFISHIDCIHCGNCLTSPSFGVRQKVL